MPRTFSPAIQGEINKRFAGEPMILVEVNWTGSTWVAYTDRKLNGAEYPYPLLVSIGQFDTTEVISGGSDSQQTTITLNDIDGTLRSIIDSHDMHLRPVRIYLTFQGLPVEEKALMFEGVVNSPIVWDEGGRTLTFSVLSKLESVEAGFTMEDGDFPFIEPQDRNKPWPLVFGKVCNMEAVQVRGTRKGFLGEGVGVMDPTIEERLCQAYKLKCPKVQTSATETGEVGDDQDGLAVAAGTGTLNPGGGGINGSAGVGGPGSSAGGGGKIQLPNVREGKTDRQCIKRRFDKICEILVEKAQQAQYVKKVFAVRGGAKFPQNQLITIQINEVKFDGVMVGETFTVTQVYHPDPKDNPPCKDIKDAKWGYRFEPGDNDNPTTVAGCAQGTDFNKDVRDGSGASWNYFNQFERSNFIWLPPGTEVLLADEAEVLCIVSLIPGVVNQVAAYRNFTDTALLTSVDTSRYTVVTTDFGGYEVVEVRLNAPLSTIPDEDWDDEIFVSFTSDIGPNPADIVEWLVETYTDLTVDTASFAAVKASLTNYPSNFFVKARPRVLDLIRDVAYQARCAVFIRDNKVFMVYLSKEPTSLKTLTASDILPNTFQITHTGTENLETRTTISWKEGEAGVFKTDPVDFEFVLKHNIPKYGVFDASYDYYTMNIFSLVEKSATFWSIRKSNTWKFVEFETPLVHLNLDVFDCVTINLPQFGPIKVVIEESTFNLDSNTISFKAWTPVRSGESTPYLWAWPALQDAAAVHPLLDNNDVEAGDDYPLQVIPPEGHPLRGAFDPNAAVLNTDGDKHPSDIGDTFPNVECKISTGAEISDDIEPEFDPFEPLAEKNFEEKMNDIEAGTTNGTSSDDAEEKEACGQPTGTPSCTYEVTITYVTATLVASSDGEHSPCKGDAPKCAGPCGCNCAGAVCTGPVSSFCHTFGARFAAEAFRNQYKAGIQNSSGPCGTPIMNCGQTAPLFASGIKGIPGPGPLGGCEDAPGLPDAPGAGDGETYKRKQSS